MQRKSPLGTDRMLAVFLCLPVFAGVASAAGPDTVLYRFQGGNDGSGPKADLIADEAGSLYGTTFSGGGQGSEGTVIRLTPPAAPGGAWTETILYRFLNLSDGQYPWAGLVSDKAGNLYGTTWLGGLFGDCGVVFELSPSGGAWAYTVLHNFACDNLTDGGESRANLVIDDSGNLFGTTSVGGTGGCFGGCGVVFELSPSGAGWNETVLYSFPASGSGESAYGGTGGGVVLDRKGNLYGTTINGGGPSSAGTVFELIRPAQPGGAWKHKVIHSFSQASEGSVPLGGLAFDGRGNLYGTTQTGAGSGCYGGGCGVVFRLTPQSAAWTYSVLHKFTGKGDGSLPQGSLLLDRLGNLHGTTQLGGTGSGCTSSGCGVVFRLNPPQQPGDAWTETVLHTLRGGKDGYVPWGRMAFGKDGLLYGATQFGGIPTCGSGWGCGTIFAVAP